MDDARDSMYNRMSLSTHDLKQNILYMLPVTVKYDIKLAIIH